jgi:DNA-binding LacI/PurR family transcriptional regulator
MQPIRLLSVGEQTVEHLRKGIQEGRWTGRLPGVVRLAEECDVSTGVVRGALRRLEAEGVITAGGLGRCRRIVPPEKGGTPLRTLRVGLLLHDSINDTDPILWEIQRDLEAAGHIVSIPKKSQIQLNHKVSSIIRMVNETAVDAWIVCAGSRELLEWFAAQSIPTIALYGRSGGLALARTGPDKASASLDSIRQLIALGHRRIVMIALAGRRKPIPGNIERLVLEEMRRHGIETGPYNLPDWEETPEGFNALLENLFRTTPPTALIISETPKFIAAMQFLARHRIDVPGQVSLISPDFDKELNWCSPTIAHMEWDNRHIVRRVVRWVAAVRKGNPDRETINFPAIFVPGGSIGPAPQIRR